MLLVLFFRCLFLINCKQEMEEISNNLFLIKSFPEQFNYELWKDIKSQTPKEYQFYQMSIYQALCKNQRLKDKYFQRFERNHLTLYGWYLLANKDKVDIEQYLFKPLLHRTPSFQNSRLNNAIKVQEPKNNGLRTQPNELRLLTSQRKQLFHEESDSHDLYLKTFVACRGDKYVPYDYDKHMKCVVKRSNYNSFIRLKHQRNNTSLSRRQNYLSKFEEWTNCSKDKTSLLSFRSVLANTQLNSQRGLQSLLKRQGTKKLVFVNHQQKPINYYLRPNQNYSTKGLTNI